MVRQGKPKMGNGKLNARLALTLAALALAVVACVVVWRRGGGGEGRKAVPSSTSDPTSRQVAKPAGEPDATDSPAAEADVEDEDGAGEPDGGAEGEPQTEEEKRAAAENKLVDAFDDLTDKWMEPSAKGVTMEDIDNFAKQFRLVPKARQDECIHRALNLIPDENVMLLAGVLLDKSVDKEIVEEVFNDILNRDEDVKEPILREVFKDKSHPCWADAAWILDVTGELP